MKIIIVGLLMISSLPVFVFLCFAFGPVETQKKYEKLADMIIKL